MDKSQNWSSGESQKSSNSWTEESSDQTKDSSKNISDLSERLESSLYISEKPESKSPELKSIEECNVPQDSDFQHSRPTILSKQSCSKETELLPNESSPSKRETPMKTVYNKSSSFIKHKVHSNNAEKLPFCSGGRSTSRISHSHQKVQCFPVSVPAQILSGYHPNVNPTILARGTNPVQNRASAYSILHPEESLSGENIVDEQKEGRLSSQCQTESSAMCQSQNKENTNQSFLPAKENTNSSSLQIPLSNIITAAQPVVSSSQSRKTFLNTMPPNWMNAAPLPNVQDSSQYQTPTPPIKMNSIPMRYSKGSFYNRKQITPRSSLEAMPHVEPSQAATLNISEKISKLHDVIQSRVDTKISGQFTTIPPIQPQPRVHYSKKKLFNREIPNLKSYFPLQSTPQKEIVRYFQGAPIQFSTPTGNISIGSRFVARQGVIPHQHVGGRASHGYSFIPPVVANKVVPLPATQDNVHIQYGAHAYNPKQLAILAKNIISFREKYQLVKQSRTAAQQYQNPNQPMFQHGLQYQSTLHNLTTATNNWEPNQPMYHYRTLPQPALQNLTAIPQYPDPNLNMHQYETQYEYQPVLKSPTSAPQYRDPNQPMYQYGMLHQPSGQNLSTASHYQDPNQPNNQYGMLHQPSWQNLSEASQYQHPNPPMYQYEKQYEYQAPLQNLSEASQYQDPNPPMYQYEKQYEYQAPLQNITASLQYQNLDHSMYQYGKQTCLETSYPVDAFYPIYDKSIPPPNENSNIVQWQTSATSMTLNNITQNPPLPYRSGDLSYSFTGDPNFVPNISDVQTSVEYSSSTSMSHDYTWPDATEGSTNQNWIENVSQDSTSYKGLLSIENPEKFGTNTYPAWSVSTSDSHKETLISEEGKTSRKQ